MGMQNKHKRAVMTTLAIAVVLIIAGVVWLMPDRSTHNYDDDDDVADFRTAVRRADNDENMTKRPLTDDEINALREDSIFNYSTSPDKTIFSLLGDVKTFRFVLKDTAESYPMVIDKMFCDRTFTYDRTGRLIDLENVLERPGFTIDIQRYKEFITNIEYENRNDPANTYEIKFYRMDENGIGSMRCVIDDGRIDRVFIGDTYFPNKIESVYCNMNEYYPNDIYSWRIELIRHIEYSDFDSHGNWLTAKVCSEGKRKSAGGKRESTCTLDPGGMVQPDYTESESPIGENIYYTVHREITYY